jgi:hypothetical protein
MLTKEKKHVRWIFSEKKERKKSTHRETTNFCFLVCESKKRKERVERLNPKRQRQNFLSLEDKTKKKKAKEIKSTKHTHTHTEWDENKKAFFGFFLNRYKKVDDKREKEWNKHTHTQTFFFFFFVFFFSWVHFKRQELQINKQRKTNNSRR